MAVEQCCNGRKYVNNVKIILCIKTFPCRLDTVTMFLQLFLVLPVAITLVVTSQVKLFAICIFGCLQCFDIVGWAAGRASGV